MKNFFIFQIFSIKFGTGFVNQQKSATDSAILNKNRCARRNYKQRRINGGIERNYQIRICGSAVKNFYFVPS